MPEIIQSKQIFSLHEVAGSIEKTLNDRYKSSFWVKAEMNKLNHYQQSGHCYPELVEKSDGKITALIKSTLWRNDFQRINQHFLKVLGEPLKDGIKILFQAKITFDAVHGLSLWIQDIDPDYTMGDLEREKLETIASLKKEGLFDKNKHKKIELLPQRIAIISVETSKGYADFMRVLLENSWGYRYFHMLFPSLLQGDDAVKEIIQQLNKIKKVHHHFDAVAIIRGGGGDVGLSCFNHYALAKAITEFPIPVLSGIGHATNETVVEMVSWYNAITPTKLAEFLIQKFHNFSVPVKEAKHKIVNASKRILQEEVSHFSNITHRFKKSSKVQVLQHEKILKENKKTIQISAKYIFYHSGIHIENLQKTFLKSMSLINQKEKQKISGNLDRIHRGTITSMKRKKMLIDGVEQKFFMSCQKNIVSNQSALYIMENNIKMLSPERILLRGFSITRFQGKAITSANSLPVGAFVETEFYDGQITSKIEKVNSKSNE